MKQLECFLKLSDLRSFGGAARALSLSQSTVTLQIQSLERSFGVELFERGPRRVELTPMGSHVRGFAEAMLGSMEAARAQIALSSGELRLRVGCGSLAPFMLLPQLLRKLGSHHPALKVEISDVAVDEQLQALTTGQVDALLLTRQLHDPSIHFDLLFSEPLLAAMSASSPLAAQSAVSVADLRGVSILCSRASDCGPDDAQVRAMLLSLGVQPQLAPAPSNCAGTLAYVSANKGIAIVTASVAACRTPGVVFLPFDEALPHFDLGLSWPAKPCAAVTLFRKLALECAPQR